MEEQGYWDRVAREVVASGSCPAWRRYSDGANRALLEEWLPEQPGRCLKTDLFDEAWTGGFLRESGPRPSAPLVGVDVSREIAALARRRRPDVDGLVADVRRLPFPDRSFDTVVSTSTLDHFSERPEIGRALAELHRILAPGGRLLVTLDNPRHPIVALRRQGLRLWQRLHLVPYDVGVSLGAEALRNALEGAGFSVRRIGASQHLPRLLLVALGRFARPPVIEAAVRLEKMGRLPTRYWTGQFVCALACRTAA